MLAQRFQKPTVKILILVTIISVISFFLGQISIQALVLTLVGFVFAIPLGIISYKLYVDERRFQRQALELEMYAHKADITANILDTGLLGVTPAFYSKLRATHLRRDKLALLMAEVGYPEALKQIKQTKKLLPFVEQLPNQEQSLEGQK